MDIITCLMPNDESIELKPMGFYENIEVGLLMKGHIKMKNGVEVYSPACILVQDNVSLIVVYEWFYTDFSEEEREIILAHEYGHKYFMREGIISNENLADTYAVEKFGLKKIIKFLQKISTYYENGGNIPERISWLLNQNYPGSKS